MYGKAEASIRLGENCSDFFTIDVGVKQGCLLSCILFLMLINDLGLELKKLNKGIKIGNTTVTCLFFADDIVLLSESRADLESLLQVAYNFSWQWRFKYNFDKSA